MIFGTVTHSDFLILGKVQDGRWLPFWKIETLPYLSNSFTDLHRLAWWCTL